MTKTHIRDMSEKVLSCGKRLTLCGKWSVRAGCSYATIYQEYPDAMWCPACVEALNKAGNAPKVTTP